MSDKVCDCQFCRDYKHLNEILPFIPAEHQEFVKQGWEAFWQADEDLVYKKAILDGSWPSSIEILEHALVRAKARLAASEEAITLQKEFAKSEQVAKDLEKEADKMLAYEHSCDVVDISDGPCGDPSHDEVDPLVQAYDKPVNRCPDCNEGFMVERINSNTGYTFLGCSEFPDCKHTTAGGSNPTSEVADRHYDYDYQAEIDDDPYDSGEHQGDFF